MQSHPRTTPRSKALAGRAAAFAGLTCLAASCTSVHSTRPVTSTGGLDPVPVLTPANSAVDTPAPMEGESLKKTRALKATVGFYDIGVGDESDIGLGVHLNGEFSGEANWGGGADLFLATTFGDAGDLDDRASAIRLWGYAMYSHPESPIQFKVGPEFIKAAAGDEIGGEYSGFGLKASVYGEAPIGETMTGFGEFGLGLNSGDGELYANGVEFDEDFTILDLMLGVRTESGVSGGLDIQLLGADEGEDVEAIGLFARFDF